jgi:hypothetical protein
MKCPYCRGVDNWRMGRPFWAVFSPGIMRNMRCGNCGREYIRYLRMFSLTQRTAKRILYIWYGICVTVVMLTLAWILPGLATGR